MVNKSKVILMSRTAMLLKKHPRDNFITGRFWVDDFLSFELWKAFIGITLAYIVAIGTWLVSYSDIWSVTYTLTRAMDMGIILAKLYVAVLICGLAVCFFTHTFRYMRAYRTQKQIRKNMKLLYGMCAASDAEQPGK